MLTPIYLQKVKTNDPMTLKQPAPLSLAQRDVVARDTPDPEGRIVARWPWCYSNKPDRRNKRVTLNCATRPAVWIPDA